MPHVRASALGVIVLVAVLAPGAGASRAAARLPQEVNARAALLADFQARVGAYLELRKKVEDTLPAPKPTTDADELAQRQRHLATGVKMARSDAKPGDIFVPEVAALLRETIRADFSERSAEQRAAAVKDVPSAPLNVNATYPTAIPLATVPPKLLARLPRLPDGLEYRFVGRRLVLHDTVTNMIVDLVDNALPLK